MTPTNVASEVQELVESDGYAYVDEERGIVEKPPKRGWYVMSGPGDSVMKMRLTDDPCDPRLKHNSVWLFTGVQG